MPSPDLRLTAARRAWRRSVTALRAALKRLLHDHGLRASSRWARSQPTPPGKLGRPGVRVDDRTESAVAGPERADLARGVQYLSGGCEGEARRLQGSRAGQGRQPATGDLSDARQRAAGRRSAGSCRLSPSRVSSPPGPQRQPRTSFDPPIRSLTPSSRLTVCQSPARHASAAAALIPILTGVRLVRLVGMATPEAAALRRLRIWQPRHPVAKEQPAKKRQAVLALAVGLLASQQPRGPRRHRLVDPEWRALPALRGHQLSARAGGPVPAAQAPDRARAWRACGPQSYAPRSRA
jgi:hypothetical protein